MDVAGVNYVPRPPAVFIMGHVDHDKTTIINALRCRLLLWSGKDTRNNNVPNGKTKRKKGKKNDPNNRFTYVAGTKAGGITQVITAFQVLLSTLSNDSTDVVTFLNTPRHTALNSMHRSGSNSTDVLVLVVASDNSVSKQTLEILDTYRNIVDDLGKDGNLGLIVAVIKNDKIGVDTEEAA